MSRTFCIFAAMKKFILAFLCTVAAWHAAAQEKVYQIEEVSVINYGDGRLLFRQLDKDKTPLQGQHRIIDGYHSEYILAAFKDGMYDGLYRHFKRNVLAEESTYKNGTLEGYRKEYYGDGKTVRKEAQFTEGKLDGVVRTYFADGKVETEVSYDKGVQDGFDRRYDAQGGGLLRDTYYKAGKPEGDWVERITSNVGDYVRRSSYKDGLRTGAYSETWSDGNVRKKGFYKDDKKDGVWTDYRRDGTPSVSTTYKAGEKTGEEKRYLSNGRPETVRNYLNGKREGPSREYHGSNGKLKTEYTYRANLKEGPYKRFYEDGALREEGRCENDSEVYRKEYHENGKLKSVAECRDGSWVTLERYDLDGNRTEPRR